MTYRSAISNVKSDLNKINADNKKTNKEIATLLEKHGEWLVDREANGFKLSRRVTNYQSYIANVIEVPKIDPCSGITTKCTIFRTKDKIPDTYEDSNGIINKEITSVDGSIEIKGATLADYKIKKNSPWGQKSDRFWFYSNGYIYGDLPKAILITNLFKHDLEYLKNCSPCKDCEKKCIRYLDSVWQIPGYLQAQVIDFVVKELAPGLNIPTQEKIDKNENRP
jgi:hypothetical protein